MARSKQPSYLRSTRLPKAEDATTPDKMRLKDYVVLNGIFAVFCVTQLIIVRLLLNDFAGLYFFFGFIMCAFITASAFDYLADKLSVGMDANDHV